jgi:hypothetical protein
VSEQVITAPEDADVERIARQLLRVNQLVMQHLGRPLADDESDLEAMQELLNERVLARDATYDLQCLGIVLRTCLVDAIEGIDWVMVEDEYGRDPALRYQESSLLIFPLTMISKRVEDGIEVDVRHMFEQLCDRIEELKDEIPQPN